MIGSWIQVKKKIENLIIFYSKSNCTMTYYLSTDKAEYKIEYSFTDIQDIHINTTGHILEILVDGIPTFSTRPRNGPEIFYECGDFTEGYQAHNVLVHRLYSQEQPAIIQIKGLKRLDSFVYRKQAPSTSATKGKGQERLHEQTQSISEALDKYSLNEPNTDVALWIRNCISNENDTELDLLGEFIPELDLLLGEPIPEIGSLPRNLPANELDKYNPDLWVDSNEFSLAKRVSSLSYISEQTEYHPYVNMDPLPILTHPFPAELPRPPSKVLSDPNCFFCHASPAIECGCESSRFELAERRTERKFFEPVKQDLRNWVRRRAEKSVLKEFEFRRGEMKQDQNVTAASREDIDPEGVLQKASSDVWAECYQQYPDVMDYFYSLVDFKLPGNNDEKVRNPTPLWDGIDTVLASEPSDGSQSAG